VVVARRVELLLLVASTAFGGAVLAVRADLFVLPFLLPTLALVRLGGWLLDAYTSGGGVGA
jgi:hypothetical protein